MWLWVFAGRQFEDTFENAQWRKVKQMQPMWLCIILCKRSEETFENAQWRKVTQMQPMWVCIFTGMQFEDPFENTHCWKVRKNSTIEIVNVSNANVYLMYNKKIYNFLAYFGLVTFFSSNLNACLCTLFVMNQVKLSFWGT